MSIQRRKDGSKRRILLVLLILLLLYYHTCYLILWYHPEATMEISNFEISRQKFLLPGVYDGNFEISRQKFLWVEKKDPALFLWLIVATDNSQYPHDSKHGVHSHTDESWPRGAYAKQDESVSVRTASNVYCTIHRQLLSFFGAVSKRTCSRWST